MCKLCWWGERFPHSATQMSCPTTCNGHTIHLFCRQHFMPISGTLSLQSLVVGGQIRFHHVRPLHGVCFGMLITTHCTFWESLLLSTTLESF